MDSYSVRVVNARRIGGTWRDENTDRLQRKQQTHTHEWVNIWGTWNLERDSMIRQIDRERDIDEDVRGSKVCYVAPPNAKWNIMDALMNTSSCTHHRLAVNRQTNLFLLYRWHRVVVVIVISAMNYVSFFSDSISLHQSVDAHFFLFCVDSALVGKLLRCKRFVCCDIEEVCIGVREWLTNNDVQRATKSFQNRITFIYYFMMATVAPLSAIPLAKSLSTTVHTFATLSMFTNSPCGTIEQKPIAFWYIFPIIFCWKFIVDRKKNSSGARFVSALHGHIENGAWKTQVFLGWPKPNCAVV